MTAQGTRRVQLLNGIWEVGPGTADAPPAQWAAKIHVPSLVDCASPPYGWQSSPFHWYRLIFQVSAPVHRVTARIRIEQAMFGTAVWLNGHHLGEDIACYTSQEYDAAEHLRYDGQNELLVRVGQKATLPSESAVGNDQERQTFIPGIWGDVALLLTGNPWIALVQVIPKNRESTAEVRVTLHNSAGVPVQVSLSSRLRERSSGRNAGKLQEIAAAVPPSGESVHVFVHSVNPLLPWGPGHPFLYEAVAGVTVNGEAADTCVTTFGMREFNIREGGFYLNGKRIFLKGGNIAFHRFLSDRDRGLLPWNTEWIKKLLVEIPKNHNFNFFRAHIGQMYNRWYDIADEGGMLLQNEWMFWTTTGTEAQITREFTRWLQDNWNHPSIVIWDPLNECSDPLVQNVIVPKMKLLDPTRPWESVDFVEEHPYIYSLGPVLNGERFGFARGLQEIEDSRTPVVLNEFLWWWLDSGNAPTVLTREVAERWLGSTWTAGELIARQSFLAAELVELFRRMRVDAIQPFVYLSNSAGPTGHWFLGNIADLVPKPLLGTLRNAFAPFGVSVELWDRHFEAGEARSLRLFIFNDDPVEREGNLRWGMVKPGGTWVAEEHLRVHVGPSGCSVLYVTLNCPGEPGRYDVVADLAGPGGESSVSRKIAHVFAEPGNDAARGLACLVLDSRGEVSGFLARQGVGMKDLRSEEVAGCSLIVVAEGMLRDQEYARRVPAIGEAVAGGAVLVVLEPEFGNREKETLTVIPGVSLTIERRADTDKGGYDSYVFPADPSHRLWKNISPEHLRMFNGALGGEMVSRHNVTPGVPMETLARCGMSLAHSAVMHAGAGKGSIVVSRIQTRGRLLPGGGPDHLYSRRVDPVAKQYLLNLVTTFLPGGSAS